MTDDYDGPLRMDVLAALVNVDIEASRAAEAWTRADGRPCTAAEADLVDSGTDDEREISSELHEGPDLAAIAQLLTLAAASDAAVLLSAGMRETLQPPVPRGERTAAFADLYRRLVLPGLDAGAREQATTLLVTVGRN
jgi:hypothetical protein